MKYVLRQAQNDKKGELQNAREKGGLLNAVIPNEADNNRQKRNPPK
jgi:hypothetical protein